MTGFSQNWFAGTLLFLVFLSGCAGQQKADSLKVVTKSLKQERAAFSSVPDELASLGSGSIGYNYWVEGTVENTGSSDIQNIVIVFYCMDGTERRKLIAHVPLLVATERAPFKTRVLPTSRTLALLDGEPEIRFR
jgi:hypothetical protein